MEVLFRVGLLASSDSTWRSVLWSRVVDNLNAALEFQRFCLPFGESGSVEPGIVIPFSATIQFERNFFGRDLAGGDHAYDPSHFATKIRSVGVWFTGYDGTGLAQTPRVYLVPVGTDFMRSPAGQGSALRTWTVFDQALPLPYDLGGGSLSATAWIALNESTSARFAERRKFGSFPAYHDSGYFDENQACANGRLVGRSVWNTQWLLMIPAGTMHANRNLALKWFIDGPAGTNGVSDIKLFFQTYSYAGN